MFVETESTLLYFSHFESDPSTGPGYPEKFMKHARNHRHPHIEGIGHRDLLSNGNIINSIKPAPEPVILGILDNIEKRR